MTLRVGAAPLQIAQVARFASSDQRVELDPAARPGLLEARALLEHLAGTSAAVYGLNSPLGANAGKTIDAGDMGAYQRRAVRARAVAVGPAYDRASTRATMLVRLAGLARGGAAASLPVIDGLIDLLNHGILPQLPRHGSIGASDMPQLAHMAQVLIGEGQAEFQGSVMSGADALQRAGLAPVELGAKDGLSLFSANALSVARACLVLNDLRQLQGDWLAAAALSFEAFRANLSPLDVDVVAARPAAGQVEVAAQLRQLLRGSALFAGTAARRLQDPLSLRVVPQVHGSAQWMLGQGIEQAEIELNSRADSPLLLRDRKALLSNGNFHAPALALSLDSCAIALAQCASLGVGRCQRFMNPALTGLPLQLTRHGPAHSGFGPLQKTLSSLWSDIRQRANPASLDFLVVSEGVEDHATMALHCVEKLAEQIQSARYLVAIEMLIAAQAIDLRGTDLASMGAGPQANFRTLRELIPMLDEDRALGPDIEVLAQALAERSLS